MTRPLLGRLVFVWDMNDWQPAHVVRQTDGSDNMAIMILGWTCATTALPCTDLSNPQFFEYLTEGKFRELEAAMASAGLKKL